MCFPHNLHHTGDSGQAQLFRKATKPSHYRCFTSARANPSGAKAPATHFSLADKVNSDTTDGPAAAQRQHAASIRIRPRSDPGGGGRPVPPRRGFPVPAAAHGATRPSSLPPAIATRPRQQQQRRRRRRRKSPEKVVAVGGGAWCHGAGHVGVGAVALIVAGRLGRGCAGGGGRGRGGGCGVVFFGYNNNNNNKRVVSAAIFVFRDHAHRGFLFPRFGGGV